MLLSLRLLRSGGSVISQRRFGRFGVEGCEGSKLQNFVAFTFSLSGEDRENVSIVCKYVYINKLY